MLALLITPESRLSFNSDVIYSAGIKLFSIPKVRVT